MKTALSIIFLTAVLFSSLRCSNTTQATPPPAQPQVPVTTSGTVSCKNLAVNADGTTCIGGFFSGVVDFDPGTEILRRDFEGVYDAFVSVFDTDGNFLWSDCWGSEREDSCEAVAITDAGAVYALGYKTKVDTRYRLDGNRMVDDPAYVQLTALRKYGPDGTLLWERTWELNRPALGRKFHQLDLDLNGNIYISGSFGGTADFDPGPFQETASEEQGWVFTCCLNPDGEFLWVKTWDGGYSIDQSAPIPTVQISDYGTIYNLHLSTNPETSGVCAGMKAYYLVTDGWERIWCEGRDVGELFDIEPAPGGPVYVNGRSTPAMDVDSGPGRFSIYADPGYFLLRLSPDGDTDWVRGWGYGSTDNPTPDTLGNTVAPTVDPLLTDAQGYVYCITFTGGELESGRANTISRVGTQALPGTRISKFDPDGNVVWMKTWENENSWPVSQVAVDNSGNIYLGSSSNRRVYAAPYGDPEVILQPAVPQYYSDCFLIKISPDGNYLWSAQFGPLIEE